MHFMHTTEVQLYALNKHVLNNYEYEPWLGMWAGRNVNLVKLAVLDLKELPALEERH